MKLDKLDNVIVHVDDKVIAKSMKKVFKEEIDKIEQELNELYNKYNIKSSKEMEIMASQDEEINKDLEKIKELEEELEKLNSYLREVNMKTI
ncbi:hypothetical protein [Methanothermococcus okinawensis]|uniref:Uncharacterized protein n=1 Tax=Methanothermococcus okinawensis (strain DSM 14208 / JCM 11175 / IH1) TaxID=647113 RepID=F8ALU6_METOI|nr:hypothetical protein [Methanothermococcus okinawensis]AEH07399.1 hypothetical protein Metok_1434 [Methanothermococcus okinawensis IH1]